MNKVYEKITLILIEADKTLPGPGSAEHDEYMRELRIGALMRHLQKNTAKGISKGRVPPGSYKPEGVGSKLIPGPGYKK